MVYGVTEMRIMAVCLMVVLTCSCHEVVDNSTPADGGSTPERREEARKIISNFFHRDADILRGPLSAKKVDRELDERGEAIDREEAQLKGRPYDGKRHVFFGGPDWDRLKAKLQRGDELYFYKSDLQSWADLHGWEGYVAIRGSVVIDVLPVAIN
jgi:hypothetical protein